MKKESYKISIIIPVYNLEGCLSRCLNSIINQTYSNLEIIVISDGSTDNSNEIIRGFANEDSRIIPIFKENTGVSDSRNCGLDVATGQYIGFVDGDDYIEPNMFEVLLKNALENDADISHCGYQMVFPSKVDYYYATNDFVIQDNHKGLYDILSGQYVEPGVWNKLYNRNVIRDIRMSIRIKYNEDLLFNLYSFANSQKSVFYDKPLYHQIIRPDSATHKSLNDNMLFDPVKVWKEIFYFCLESYDKEIQSLAYRSYLTSILRLYRIINNNKLYKKKNWAKEYKQDIKNIDISFPLSKRNRLERFLFLYFEPIHMFIYSVYDKYISKNTNKYEVK